MFQDRISATRRRSDRRFNGSLTIKIYKTLCGRRSSAGSRSAPRGITEERARARRRTHTALPFFSLSPVSFCLQRCNQLPRSRQTPATIQGRPKNNLTIGNPARGVRCGHRCACRRRPGPRSLRTASRCSCFAASASPAPRRFLPTASRQPISPISARRYHRPILSRSRKRSAISTAPPVFTSAARSFRRRTSRTAACASR